MGKTKNNSEEIYTSLDKYGYCVLQGDSIKKINSLKDKSISLMYGSPPYPNAKRNYKTWKIENYIDEIDPFIKNVIPKLTDNGFIVINVKANRTNPSSPDISSERSLIIEELMIHMKKDLNLYCVDIEIWLKSNPVPTGVRVSCQDAYEYNLWFSKAPKWTIDIDHIRRKYSDSTLETYKRTTFKRRQNGLLYVSKDKKIEPNDKGALPLNVLVDEKHNLSNLLLREQQAINSHTNVVYGSVSSKQDKHQAMQPEYLPRKYILSCTAENDIVLDPWVGSGTTGIVAIKTGRKFIGFDISEEFSSLARENISQVKYESEEEQKNA